MLISGLGAQLVTWRSDFCRRLADRGYHGVRFDNRDVRLSTKFPDGSYTVADMTDDVAGLIEALGFGSSHSSPPATTRSTSSRPSWPARGVHLLVHYDATWDRREQRGSPQRA